jgi:hypothetical protein
VAKTVNAPIFHVNGDDPEAVVHTLKLAAEYRQAFKKDVVIDIICYRRAGHNEGDEPRYTQPQMYRMIDKHPSTLDLYRAKLKTEGVVDDERIKQMEDFVSEEYNKSFQASSTHVPNKADWFSSYWKGFKSAHQYSSIRPTAIPDSTISKALFFSFPFPDLALPLPSPIPRRQRIDALPPPDRRRSKHAACRYEAPPEPGEAHQAEAAHVRDGQEYRLGHG